MYAIYEKDKARKRLIPISFHMLSWCFFFHHTVYFIELTIASFLWNGWMEWMEMQQIYGLKSLGLFSVGDQNRDITL